MIYMYPHKHTILYGNIIFSIIFSDGDIKFYTVAMAMLYISTDYKIIQHQ